MLGRQASVNLFLDIVFGFSTLHIRKLIYGDGKKKGLLSPNNKGYFNIIHRFALKVTYVAEMIINS